MLLNFCYPSIIHVVDRNIRSDDSVFCLEFRSPAALHMLGFQLEEKRQAGTELGQAQLKLGLELTLIFSTFGFSRFGSMELVRLIWFCWFN